MIVFANLTLADGEKIAIRVSEIESVTDSGVIVMRSGAVHEVDTEDHPAWDLWLGEVAPVWLANDHAHWEDHCPDCGEHRDPCRCVRAYADQAEERQA